VAEKKAGVVMTTWQERYLSCEKQHGTYSEVATGNVAEISKFARGIMAGIEVARG